MEDKALKSKTISKKSTEWMEKVFSPSHVKNSKMRILLSNLKAQNCWTHREGRTDGGNQIGFEWIPSLEKQHHKLFKYFIYLATLCFTRNIYERETQRIKNTFYTHFTFYVYNSTWVLLVFMVSNISFISVSFYRNTKTRGRQTLRRWKVF